MKLYPNFSECLMSCKIYSEENLSLEFGAKAPVSKIIFVTVKSCVEPTISLMIKLAAWQGSIKSLKLWKKR